MTDKPNATNVFASALADAAASASNTVQVTATAAPAPTPLTTGMVASAAGTAALRTVPAEKATLPEAGYKSALVSRIATVKPVATVKGVCYFDEEAINNDEAAKARAEKLVESGRLTKY